jgi:hypothetical protein
MSVRRREREAVDHMPKSGCQKAFPIGLDGSDRQLLQSDDVGHARSDCIEL